mgnify:CR=1 FL=1
MTTTVLDVREVGFGISAVDYATGWDLQRRVHADVVAGDAADTVLLLEHQSVYTAGRRTGPAPRPSTISTPSPPVRCEGSPSAT